MKPSSALTVVLVWLALALTTLLIALPQIGDLGLYYDEAFLAQQARDFVEPDRAGVHPPSVQSISIAGRSFPIRNAAYLGSLKSQLLIPSLALFGSSPFVLRTTTLVIGLLGLLFFMLWINRLLGGGVAMISGLLIASDPSFHFFAQFEWGPFTSMLLCRGAGLYLLSLAFDFDRPGLRWFSLSMGAACMGLGVYSRVDFVVILAALAISLLAFRRDLVSTALREHRAKLIVGSAVFLLTASPVIAALDPILSAGAQIADRGGFDYRVNVLASVLDGSHFHRVIAAGGLFDELFADELLAGSAPTTGFIVLLCASVIALISLVQRSSTTRAGTVRFLLSSALLVGLGMLAIPAAVRAHHMLNTLPLPHLIVAAAGVGLWHRGWASDRNQKLARASLVVALIAGLTSNATSLAATRGLIHETGGVGRWSLALQEFIGETDLAPNATKTEVVSLDWGFHEPVLFTTQRLKASEPIWAMSQAAARRARYVMKGDRDTIYLIHEPPYDLFGFGRQFVRALRVSDPERYTVEQHRDGVGNLAFKSVRFDRPHELSFDGIFRIKLSEAEPPRPAPVVAP
ncbi:MAG: glycosyltransferase family 39 protein [Deltaproteobacteria bacterium]|nr:glycosyltransferase family 39 protein [Deltaproteobacteria bacterium]